MAVPRRTKRVAAAPVAPPRKPMVRADRVSLFEREVRVRLAPVGLDVLFDAARVLTEGQDDGDRYCGSTMMTIDLGGVSRRVSDLCDASTARRVAQLAGGDERVRERARRLAVAEVEARGTSLDAPTIDVRVRPVGRVLHLDLDVEARRKP